METLKQQLDAILNFYRKAANEVGSIQPISFPDIALLAFDTPNVFIPTEPLLYVQSAYCKFGDREFHIERGHVYKGRYNPKKDSLIGIVEYDLFANCISNIVEHQKGGKAEAQKPIKVPFDLVRRNRIYMLSKVPAPHPVP